MTQTGGRNIRLKRLFELSLCLLAGTALLWESRAPLPAKAASAGGSGVQIDDDNKNGGIPSPASAVASETATGTPAERGYRLLTTKAYLPADFDNEVFENLWKVWPQPERDRAREVSPAERRRMAFSRYGLMPRPDDRGTGPALGYLDDGHGGWVMTCLACHTGKVAGKVVLGSPNSHFGLQTLTEEVRLVKLQQGKPLTHMDLGSLKIPLGETNGTTNAVVFGVALGAFRDKDLNVLKERAPRKFIHHDMDAPPFWNVRKKTGLYCDGFAARDHRVLMQFLLLPQNTADILKSWESDFVDIQAWIESLEPPAYPWAIDATLAARGRTVFESNCAHCHGTYGKQETYPNKIVPLDVVQTDPVRLRALEPEYRQALGEGWFGHYGEKPYIADPGGYVAPPLDGIWASAPYLHNGSVPTLWHVLHPAERPVVWQRTENGYDQDRVGLEVTSFDDLPATVRTPAERRTYFDTRLKGKSAAGHRFPDRLTEDEKRAVLEYLKTL